MKLINRIYGTIENSNKAIDIPTNGKNMIIAGGNGSGKTSLALSIFKTLQTQIVNENILKTTQFENNIRILKNSLKISNPDDSERFYIEQNIKSNIESLKSIKGPLTLDYNQAIEAILLYKSKKSTFRFFAADRKAAITSVSYATASQPDTQSINTSEALGNSLEQHLVNLKVRSALAMQDGENGPRALHANDWIESLTENLKYLFEDNSTELKFIPDKLKFTISQTGKPSYSFQSLSSGYLAILDIYADLLMHTEYIQIKPSELSGVVIIDEIDAHLHVSLQRKILPFFTGSFPKIQFIVTTHSPFVLTSIDDAIIFDITTGQITSDLSMFSYESVVEGLLGVPPISRKFEETIKKLTEYTSKSPADFRAAEKLLNQIKPYVDVLDAESEMFYQIAANKIIKSKTESK